MSILEFAPKSFEKTDIRDDVVKKMWDKKQLTLTRGYDVPRIKQYESIKYEARDISPSKAIQYIGTQVINRSIHWSNVADIYNSMLNNKYPNTGEPIRFNWNGELADGQHRLIAATLAEYTIKNQLIVKGIDPKHFKYIDIGDTRSSGDAVDLYFKDKGEVISKNNKSVLAGMAKHLIIHCMGNGMHRTARRRILNDHIVAMVDTFPDLIQSVEAVKNTSKLGTTSLFAAMHWLFSNQYSPKLADAYFSSLSTGADLGVRSPILKARTALQDRRLNKDLSFTTHFQLATVSKGWNSFINKKPYPRAKYDPAEDINIYSPDLRKIAEIKSA